MNNTRGIGRFFENFSKLLFLSVAITQRNALVCEIQFFFNSKHSSNTNMFG